MFSFRRKPSKAGPNTPRIKTSPSLPELSSQGIPWPENLVNVDAIRQTPPPGIPQQGAVKSLLQGISHTTIPFHKPFRGSSGKRNDGGTISSLYMSSPPSAFDNKKSSAPISRYSQRRARIPPTFNLMVVGGKGTGKTSLLRLLIETADISPSATADQRTLVNHFLQGSTKTTETIQTACIEICESRFDRVLFSVIDTPGLDFIEGHELKLERQVNGIIKYIDVQYADTMSEESKVVRQNKGDRHIHLCIYMIDPSSIMTAATSSLKSSDEGNEVPLSMSPTEIKVIRRLSARSNVLPVIAHTDSLTDEKLLAIKDAVRTGLAKAGLDFGVFGSQNMAETDNRKKSIQSVKSEDHSPAQDDTSRQDSEEDERQARPVIKLRSSRHSGRNVSHSRSRRDLSQAADDDHRPLTPDPADRDSVANVRFSAHISANMDLGHLMPFALIAPESRHRRHQLAADNSIWNGVPSDEPSQPIDTTPQTPTSVHNTHNTMHLQVPPDDLKGVFIRKFRWGTVDVLNPEHCDFSALRTAILSTHFKILKTHTKEVLYERYRTEKLLARRATRQLSDGERQRLIDGL